MLPMPFENCPLPYTYDALEPCIDAKTMELHHDRHLQTYIDNLNLALESLPALQSRSAAQLAVLQNRPTISKNAGGVFNHRFYFCGMTPHCERRTPCGALEQAIRRHFCTQENFTKAFTAAALHVFGSGYAWLACNRQKQLMIVTTANQEVPMLRGLRPLLCCDVWEHAYYLKHYNRRADYIHNWLQVIDWQRADALFTGELALFE
ncbi:MAG: superoxide dismutase [Clostridia bacterium]|nr:superoxide dismutase [Clostridia bacterium]